MIYYLKGLYLMKNSFNKILTISIVIAIIITIIVMGCTTFELYLGYVSVTVTDIPEYYENVLVFMVFCKGPNERDLIANAYYIQEGPFVNDWLTLDIAWRRRSYMPRFDKPVYYTIHFGFEDNETGDLLSLYTSFWDYEIVLGDNVIAFDKFIRIPDKN